MIDAPIPHLRRALVIDGQPVAAGLAADALRTAGYDVEIAMSSEAGITAALTSQHDVVVLEAGLPDMTGIAVARHLRAVGLGTAIVFYARDATLEVRVAGLDAGADDYMGKSTTTAELVARVRAVVRRANPTTPGRLCVEDLVLDTGTYDVRRAGVPIDLTPNQYRLLHYLMSRPNRLVSKGALFRDVWGREWEGDDNVVETCMARLRAKLGRHGPPLIQTVRDRGYVLRSPP